MPRPLQGGRENAFKVNDVPLFRKLAAADAAAKEQRRRRQRRRHLHDARALRDEFFLLLSDGQTAVDTRPGKNGAWMATRVAMMMAGMAALDHYHCQLQPKLL